MRGSSGRRSEMFLVAECREKKGWLGWWRRSVDGIIRLSIQFNPWVGAGGRFFTRLVFRKRNGTVVVSILRGKESPDGACVGREREGKRHEQVKRTERREAGIHVTQQTKRTTLAYFLSSVMICYDCACQLRAQWCTACVTPGATKRARRCSSAAPSLGTAAASVLGSA